MIHQPLGGAQGQAADIEIQANEILHHKLTLNGYLAEFTGQGMERITQDTGQTCCAADAVLTRFPHHSQTLRCKGSQNEATEHLTFNVCFNDSNDANLQCMIVMQHRSWLQLVLACLRYALVAHLVATDLTLYLVCLQIEIFSCQPRRLSTMA